MRKSHLTRLVYCVPTYSAQWDMVVPYYQTLTIASTCTYLSQDY